MAGIYRRIHDRISDQYHRAGVAYTINSWKLASVLVPSGAMAVTAQQAPQVRDNLPEPIDVFDHVGNFFDTAGVVVVATTAAHYAYSKRPDATSRGAKLVGMGAALLTGLAANVYGETALCEPLFNAFNYPPTSDPIDFAYGMAGAAATGAAMASIGASDAPQDQGQSAVLPPLTSDSEA